MKLFLLFLILSAQTWAKPIVLLGHFDTFGRASFNNSERVAKRLMEKLHAHPDFELKLCSLRTVFDKSFYQLEDCVKELPEAPKLVLGLGESNCNMKLETISRNLDKTKGPDNDGVERINQVIIPEAAQEIGFNYPLAQMYCALGESDRDLLEVSNHAGTFVCNNLSFQFAYKYPETNFGFIHVPANHCRNLEVKTQAAVRNLEKMIIAAVGAKKSARLLTRKKDLEKLRSLHQNDRCLSEFYSRTRGVDEKGFWTFSRKD